ncbi:hypothetical protein [Spirosoma aerophilum]
MSTSIIHVLVLTLGCLCAQAQTAIVTPCDLQERLLKEAKKLQTDSLYIDALNKLFSARVAARNCKASNVNRVDQQIEYIYKQVIALKDLAEEAKAKAILERIKAEIAAHDALKAKAEAERQKKIAQLAAGEALLAKRKAEESAQKADSSARITEASRLRTIALQVREDDPTLALQLIKKACDTSYFNYKDAVTLLRSILSTTHPASYYVKKFEKMDDDVSSAVMSANGKTLIMGSNTGSIDVWHLAKTQDRETWESITKAAGHTGAILSLAVSDDGELIVSAGVDGKIGLWNGKLEKQSTTFEDHTGAVLSVAISPDKLHIVSSGEDKTIKVWSLTNGTLEKKLTLTYGNAVQVCFSPNGNFVGIAGNDEVVRVWDWQNNKVIATLEGHIGAVRSVAFSPDGSQIVSAGDDKTVRVWDWQKSTIKHILQGHQGSVVDVRFSSDMAYIVSTSLDKTVKVWNWRNESVYRELRGHHKGVFAAGFYDKDHSIYTGSYDGSAKLWDWKEDRIVNPNLITSNNKKSSVLIVQSDSESRTKPNSLSALSQSDTTQFSRYIVTQGSDNTVWLWDTTPTSKPAYIVYDREKGPANLPTSVPIINSRKFYSEFYQKLQNVNGKLIPTLTYADLLKFFNNPQ